CSLPKSFGPRGADIIFAQDFQNSRARHTRSDCGVAIADREGGPDKLHQVGLGIDPERRKSAGGQPMEVDNNSKNYNHPNAKGRDGEPGNGKNPDTVVDPGVLLYSCESTERYRDQNRNKSRHQREFNAQLQSNGDFMRNGLPGPHRGAKVEVNNTPYPTHEL